MKKKHIHFKLQLGVMACIFFLACKPLVAQVVQTFSFTGSIVNFTVPQCVSTITMEAWGAQGGTIPSYPGGLGAYMSGTFSVTPGQVLRVLVGGQGSDIQSTPAATGGGGGSFVALLNGTNTPLPWLVAGGGGGRRNITQGPAGNADAVTGTTAQLATTTSGAAGSLGNGGQSGEPQGGGTGGPGGGFYTNGGPCGTTPPTPGFAFVNGGAIAPTCSPFTSGTSSAGGFGGGGGGCWCYRGTPGGGGGYSGGATGVNDNAAGGGASYNIGSAQTNSAGVRSGNGQIRFTYNFSGILTSVTAAPGMVCLGNNSTLSSSGMVSYTWSTGSNANSIIVSPTSSTSYTVAGTNTLGCVSTAVVTVSVSSGVPTLAVLSSTNQTCLGKTATLTASGALTYTWSNSVINGVSFNPSVTTTYTVFGQNGCGTTSAVTTITVAPLPVAVVISPTLTCAGSGATLTSTSGGTTFTWSPGGSNTPTTVVSPTVTTIYTISVSDGTCFGNASISLSVNPIPTIVVVASSSTACQGSAITMTASGGLSYIWTPGNLTGTIITVSPNVPTLYNVTGINSFSCTSSANQVVVTQPSPTITLAASDYLICKGGSSTISAIGATTYTWSTNSNATSIVVNPISTTVYTVMGMDPGNNCPATETVQISVFDPLVTISGATAICSGASATLSASGADTYQWDNGAPVPVITVSPLSTTIYTVSALTATGNINCPSTQTIQVIVNPNPTLNVVPTRTFMCIKESNTLTASGAPNYSWSTGATTSSIVISSTIATTINYSVIGTDANGCKNSKVYQLKINGCTAIEENSNTTGFTFYPNPSNGNVFLESQIDLELRITNELGQLIKVVNLNAGNGRKLQLNDLSNGIYFISGDKVNAKIVVEN